MRVQKTNREGSHDTHPNVDTLDHTSMDVQILDIRGNADMRTQRQHKLRAPGQPKVA